MEERISRLGVLILSVLEEEMAHNLYTGLTIKDIKEKLQEGVAEQEITFYKTCLLYTSDAADEARV